MREINKQIQPCLLVLVNFKICSAPKKPRDILFIPSTLKQNSACVCKDGGYRELGLLLLAHIERFTHMASVYANVLNKRKRLHKKKFQIPQDWLEHQHGRRFIVLEDQYGRCDIPKRSISKSCYCSSVGCLK